ncbi:MAG: DMT family transporter [Chloroflexi bacterium]|nr:DMT family transporter [Chloroflexota bacterium]
MSTSAAVKRALKDRVTLGILASLAAAFCYGLSQFLGRKMVTEFAPPLVVATFAPLFGTAVLALVSTRAMVRDRKAPMRAYLIMAVAGLAASSGVAFSYIALSKAPLVVVAPITAVSPLVSLALAQVFLHQLERITWRIWLGAVLVVGGVILVTMGSLRG